MFVTVGIKLENLQRYHRHLVLVMETLNERLSSSIGRTFKITSFKCPNIRASDFVKWA